MLLSVLLSFKVCSLLGVGASCGSSCGSSYAICKKLGVGVLYDKYPSADTMLEVAVIGAGTSGLVAARQLIHAGLRPTIFEAAKTIGGAWTPSSVVTSQSQAQAPPVSNDHHHHPASKMWNGMHTNLSKYTCRFSDWPWPEDASTFPSVEEMHDYLNSYAESFLTTSEDACNFQLECKVFNVEQLEGSSSSAEDATSSSNYKVEWTDLTTQTVHTRGFGGVVVATGFFNTPRWPSFLKQTRRTDDEDETKEYSQFIHSKEYSTHLPFKDKNVAVIGSSFSALEIAADVSKSAASVVNVAPSIPWVLPRWIPTIQPVQSLNIGEGKVDVIDGSTTMTVLPADLVLYQRTQPYPPKVPETISMSTEDCRLRHKYLQSLVGQKQGNSTLREPSNWDEPPLVAISDEYLDLVRELKIAVVHGRLIGVGEDGTLQISDEENADNISPLSGIDHVICCTGYIPRLHDILSTDILSKLDYSEDDCFSPMTLAWDTLHPSLPNFAFCGMYRGPYMGVMELQAKLAAGAISGSLTLEDEQYQSALKRSQEIRDSSPHTQFPHFDYTGFMDTLSQLCYKDEYPKYNRDEGDMAVPTFYQPDDDLSRQCKSELQREIQCGQDGSRMPKIVLQSILGQWTYDRHIVHLSNNKVERVYGKVKYSKYWERDSSGDDDNEKDNADELFTEETNDNPVLYREDGVYEFSPTQTFDVFREYEYEVKHDTLDIYFVEGGKRAHIFLSLKFVPDTTSEGKYSNDDDNGYWVKATSDHLCIKDLYSATFRVKLNGLSASEIIIKYRVKGPAKDYESTTILKPQRS